MKSPNANLLQDNFIILFCFFCFKSTKSQLLFDPVRLRFTFLRKFKNSMDRYLMRSAHTHFVFIRLPSPIKIIKPIQFHNRNDKQSDHLFDAKMCRVHWICFMYNLIGCWVVCSTIAHKIIAADYFLIQFFFAVLYFSFFLPNYNSLLK